MTAVRRPAPFVLIASNHGTMIVNRNDYHRLDANTVYGVGSQIMDYSSFDPEEVEAVHGILNLRRRLYGDGVMMIDCGANIGVHTVECGRQMHGWGHVYAFEAQEKIFYALAGNIIINNCLNVTARHAAVGRENGTMTIPEPDYLLPSSFGSLELRGTSRTEFIGQKIDYAGAKKSVALVALDTLGLARLDFLKIDVEGMEEEVLIGAQKLIAACKPVLMIEIIKSDRARITHFLSTHGYDAHLVGLNLIAVHHDDSARDAMHFKQGVVTFS